MMNLENVIEAKNIELTYGKKKDSIFAVQNASFSISKGKTLGIVGESGCGKTSLALSLIGLAGNNSEVTGELSLNGQDYDLAQMDYKTWRKIRGTEVSMVFQDSLASLNPLKKIGSQVAEAITVKNKVSKADARMRASELLELVEIPDIDLRMKQYPHQLSGGMRQRVMIAIALANNPSLLICDEPTTALDVTIQSQILKLISKVQAEFNMAVLFISHDLGVINAISDDIGVMYAGKMVEYGGSFTVLTQPAHPYTDSLIKAVPDLVGDRKLLAIEGFPPQLNQKFESCPFGDRCQYVQEKCTQSMPDLVGIGNAEEGHNCACFFPLKPKVGANNE